MALRALVDRLQLSKLNSLTKYPSIATYHALGEKGRLREERNRSFSPDARVVITEKLDGTNTRIVMLPSTGEYLIGSREEWLHARGDLVFNPALGIVDAVRSTAERMVEALRGRDGLLALYGEVYGGKVTAASKEYTAGDASLMGFRVFDAWASPIDALVDRCERSTPEQLAAWREESAQPWLDEAQLARIAEEIQLERTPRIDAPAPPESVADVWRWLQSTMPRSLAPLSHNAAGRPEGVVVRTHDRSVIAKIRYEDVQRAAVVVPAAE